MPEAEPTYNLKAVVQRTGIPAASLRAWERRYGIPAPVRKENGHRVYTAAEVERLLRMKLLMAQGMTAGQAASQVEHVRTPVAVSPQSEIERLEAELAQALDRLDSAAANRLFAAALDLLPVEQVCLRLVRPLVRKVAPFGRTYLRTKLGALLLHAPGGHGRTALVMAPDPGDLEPLVAAVFLSRRGHDVIYVEGTEPPPGLTPDLLIDPREWGKQGKTPDQLFA